MDPGILAVVVIAGLVGVWLFVKAVAFVAKLVIAVVVLAVLAIGVGAATGRLELPGAAPSTTPAPAAK